MSLSEDLKNIITKHGVDILSNPQVINYFSDLGISSKYPYAIPILKDILSQHGTEVVSTYKSEDKSSLNNLLRKIQNKYISASIYNEKRILEIFDALAFSLDTQINVETSQEILQETSHSQPDDEQVEEQESKEKTIKIIEEGIEKLQKLRQSFCDKYITEEMASSIEDLLDEFSQNVESGMIDPEALSTPEIIRELQLMRKMIYELPYLAKVKLEIQRTYESHSSPPRIDNITTWLGMDLSTEFIIYNYLVDDMQRMVDRATKRTNISNNIYKSSADPESFFHTITKAGIGICHHFTDSITNYSFDIVFTNDELTALLHEPMSDIQLLEYKVQNENATLPKATDSNTIAEKIIIEQYYVVYVGLIHPYSYFKNVRRNQIAFNKLKQVIAGNIANSGDVNNKRFFKLVARLGKGLHYHYHSDPIKGFMGIGAKEPETLDIYFTNIELQQLI